MIIKMPSPQGVEIKGLTMGYKIGIIWGYGDWHVIDYKCEKQINNLPVQCKKKYAIFKHRIEKQGFNGLREYPGFRLEALHGQLKDRYSIRLNLAYRVVFGVSLIRKRITVFEVSKHKYRS